jgi:hypothetical protein
MLLRRAERWIFAPIASFTSLPGTMWGSWMALAVLLENSWRVLEMNTRYGIELQEALLISFLFIFYLEQRFGLTPANPAPQVGALKLETLQFLAFAIDVLIHYVASRLFGLSFDGELALAPLVFLFLLRAMLETANPSWTIFERVLSFVGNLRFNVLLLAATLYAVLSAYGDRIVREVLERPRPSGTGISSSILEIQFAVMPAFVMAIFFSMSLAFCSLIFQQMTSSSDERWSFGNIASDAFRLLKWVAPRILVAGIVIFWVAAWQMSLTWMLPPLALASWWLGRSARFVFIGAGLLAVATSSFLALILADLKYLPSTTNNHDYAGGAWCIAALYFWMRYIDDGDFRRRALAMSQVSWLELALIAVALAPVAFLKSGRGDVSIDPLPMLMSVLVIAGLSNMPLSRPLALIAMLFAIWVGTSATGLQSRDVFWLTFGINPGQGFAALLALLSPRVVQFIVLRQQSNPSWQDHPQNSYSTRAFITFAMALVAICASHEPYLAAPTAIFITMSAFTIELGLLLAFFAGFVSGQMRFGTLVFTAAPPLAFAAAPSSIGLAAYVSDGATIVANSLACLAWFALGIATRRITTYGSLRLPGTTGENTASKSTSEVS